MKSSFSETARSSRATSRTRSIGRKSRASILQTRGSEDSTLEPIKKRWREILEEEGVTSFVNMVRITEPAKPILSLDIEKEPVLKVVLSEEEEPTDLQVQGEIAEREVFKSVCSFFSSFATISILRLIDCKLNAEAILVLGNYLNEAPHLKKLSLDLNPVSGEDFSPLLDNITLEVLSLKGCAITGQGAKLIAGKLPQQHMSLRVLNLNTNMIDDVGAEAISRGLKWSKRLACLSLAGNNIGSAGAISLISVLKQFPLDQIDLVDRRRKLLERATLILDIVKERKDSYLATIPPMPPFPSSDDPFSTKSRKGDASLKSRKKSETKVMSKSQKVLTSSSRMTSNGDRSKPGKKEKRVSQQTSQYSRSRPSVKQAKSSVTAISEYVTETASKPEHDGDTETIELSDDDSITEFSQLENAVTEDWDRADNKARYISKMLMKLAQDVGNELHHDAAFDTTYLSRVFMNQLTGKLCSRGNLSLSHLNLSYNKIGEDVFEELMNALTYHERMSIEAGARKGIRVVMLEGNKIPQERLAVVETFLRPQLSKSSSSEKSLAK